MARMAGEEALNLVKNAIKFMLDKKGFGSVLEKIAIKSAGDGNCLAEFTVDGDMTNAFGTLHGGCTATIIDIISTLGLMTFKGSPPGVSVNITVNYLKAAKEGENILVDSKAIKVGKTLAYLDVQLKQKDSGAVIATGSHVKYVGG